MADFECVTRSNYFRVVDPEAFRKFMSCVNGSANVELWEEKDKEDHLVFGFGLHGYISGYSIGNADDECDEECDFDAFLSILQKHIVYDDAAIIMIAGHEKLRYVVGSAIIVTSKDVVFFDATQNATMYASQLLNNENWTTKCDY